MALITVPIPNMLNGVSQQTPGLRFATQAEAQENAYSSPVEGLGKRPPTEHVAKLYDGNSGTINSAFTHVIDRGDGTERYVVVISGGQIKVFDINGAEQTVTLGTGASSYLSAVGAQDFKAVSVGDYTFILNKTKVPALSSTLTPSRTNQALIWVKQGAFGTKYTVSGAFEYDYKSIAGTVGSGYLAAAASYANSNNGMTATGSTSVAGETFPVGTSNADSSYIAAEIVQNLKFTNFTSPPGNNTAFNWKIRRGTTICIIPVSGNGYIPADPFEINVSDGISGSGLGLVYKSVSSFSDLPALARHNMVVEVTGLPESNQDNYWVKFVGSDPTYTDSTGTYDNISDGTWEECIAPGVKYKYDYTTMPHVLIRQAGGGFIFKQANGLDSYPNAVWADRAVGDDTSNSAPSFIGNKINDIFLFRGRLGFLAGENIILSEVSQFFNFWRTTVTTLLDSDPIDVGSSHPSITIFRSAIAFAERLVVFSDQTQFILTGSPNLTPTTAVLNVVANYDCLNIPRPAVAGESIFFAFDRGGYSGVREMIANPDDTSLLVAPDISAQIPKYIQGKAVTLAASTHDNLLAVLADGNQKKVYIYKWLNSGNERVQSSWSEWTFNSHPSQGTFPEFVLGMAWSKSTLYLVVQRSHSVNLEKITIEPNRKDANSKFVTCLDRRLSHSQLASRSYNSSTNLTTITLPTGYRVNDPAKLRVVQQATVSQEAGYTYEISPLPSASATSFTVVGNVTNVNLWVGDAYTTRYEFSSPYLKGSSDGSRTAFASGRFQLRNMSLLYSSSSYFRAQVTNKFNNTQYSYQFTGNILGTGLGIIGDVPVVDGTFKFPIYGKNDEMRIELVNDTHMPSFFLGAEYESSYDTRAQRA
jgi:hypothetical protein